MLAGCTMGTDTGQHTGQQVELVRNKGINLCKIFCIGVQLFLHTIVEHDQILDNGALLVIDEPQTLGRRLCLFQNSLFDNCIHIRRGQGQTGIKAALDLREIVSLDLGNGVNVLLRGHNDPCLALALLTQFLGHSLQIQHQLRIIADILADFIHQKDDMVITALLFEIGLHTFGKVLNANLVGFCCFFAPVTGSRFTHEIHCHQNIHNCILNKVKILSGIFPLITVFVRKLFLKLCQTAFF